MKFSGVQHAVPLDHFYDTLSPHVPLHINTLTVLQALPDFLAQCLV